MIPERWLRVAVGDVDEERAALVAEALVEAGGRAAVEEPDGWVTYVAPPQDPEAWVADLEARIRDAVGVPLPVRWSWQAHEDWEVLWRTGLGPRRVGRRLVVAPTWTDPEPGPDDVVLRIDPGMAFGTAEHATTRVALTLLEPAVTPGARVLDVGAGSAILAIAAVRLGAAEALGIELDPWAASEAEENARANGVGDRVRMEARAFLPEDDVGTFDGVVSNMVSSRLRAALSGLLRALPPGGWLVLSGIELHESDAMAELLAGTGLTLEETATDEGWWGARYRRT